MREIKFRGKTKIENEWVYGFLTESYGTLGIQERVMCLDGEPMVVSYEFCAVDPKTIGQFTGLLDKKRKKIYEGDIVKNTMNKLEKVVFVNGCFQCASIEHQNANLYLLDTYTSFIEVVGNIYDNHELLKGGGQ